MNQQYGRNTFIRFALLALFVTAAGSITAAGAAEYEYIDKLFRKMYTFTVKPDQVMIRFQDNLSETDMDVENVLSKYQLSTIESAVDHLSFGVYEVPIGGNMDALIMSLEEEKSVRAAHVVLVDQEGFTKYFIPDQLTVQFETDIDEAAMLHIIAGSGLSIVRDHWTPGYYTLEHPADEETFEVIRAMIGLPEVSFAELNVVGFNDMTLIPNDTFYPDQWALNNTGQSGGTSGADINIEDGWDIERGDANVLLAIIDTGVDWDHEDLQENIWNNLGEDADGDGHTMEWNGSNWVLDPGDLNGVDDDSNGQIDDLIGWDFDSNDNDPNDLGDHGTACSGIAAAVTDNGIGVAGIANECTIMPLRVSLISGANANRADAINYAASFINDYDGIVLSNSWRMSSGDFTAVENAIIAAHAAGVVVVFSAGNDDTFPPNYPARYEDALAVGGTDMCDERKRPAGCDDEPFWGASYGDELSVSSPCVEIYTTDRTGGSGYSGNNYFSSFNGTSSACPMVAGAAALVISHYVELTGGGTPISPDEVQEILEVSADKVGGYDYNYDAGRPGASFELGYGRINVHSALLEVIDRYGGGGPSICDDITSFQARCITGAPYTVQFRVNLPNNLAHSGEDVTFDVDGTQYVATIVDNGTHSRASFQLTGQAAGPHTVSLLDPADCFDPIVVNCGPSDNLSADWEATEMLWGDLTNETAEPVVTELIGNYPNPFNPSTTINYSLSAESWVSLKIYNTLGQEVVSLIEGHQDAGYQSVVWNGRDNTGRSVSSGFYVYRMTARHTEGGQAGDFVETKKLLLLK